MFAFFDIFNDSGDAMADHAFPFHVAFGLVTFDHLIFRVSTTVKQTVNFYAGYPFHAGQPTMKKNLAIQIHIIQRDHMG